mmetsp:Transcript_13910/g.21513  ORF Transcript_13910/g.21513 Transcript_13910/m.21513 type:complete len:241 (+) Transcript_13910:236-958(+)
MFIAAFLDFRCRIGLKKKWMIPEQYDDLRDMILELMVDVAKEAIANATNDNAADKSEGEAQSSSKSAEAGFAFDGAFDFEDEEDDDVENDNDATNEQNIRIRCEASLSAYELLGPMSMKDAEGNFNDPLQRWKEIASQFPELAKLAQEFLSIPATSAPSERIWSRAARVITAKRSQIDPTITSRIMFAQENSRLIHKYWDELMAEEDEEEGGVSLSKDYIPPAFQNLDEDGNPIDVGQDD